MKPCAALRICQEKKKKKWGGIENKDIERNIGRWREIKKAQNSGSHRPPLVTLKNGAHQAQLSMGLCKIHIIYHIYHTAPKSRSPSCVSVGRAIKYKNES